MPANGAAAAPAAAELRVDLKTTLANERTVLRWMRSAVMLGGLATFLLNFKGDVKTQLNGLLLSVVAVFFTCWPLKDFLYRSRAYRDLSLQRQPKVDQTLPKVLSVSLGGILSAILIVEWAFGTGA
mmetsp:Transcript_75351/g.199951  ORF Transcript_75351/g.199951 Transcript_75351/m.199951 type:complete len:126 (+) Transcript_75351:103-480(+)